MTGVAGVGAINVRSGFTGSDCSVMTTETGSRDLAMINRRCGNWRPGGREHGMTGVTAIGTVNVGWALAASCRSIVTGKTIIDETGVINRRYL